MFNEVLELRKQARSQMHQSIHLMVKYEPQELKARFRYKRLNPETKKVTYGVQFDPLGYEAIRDEK